MAVLRGLLRRGTVLENNVVHAVASTGESLAAGVIFTVPALIFLDLHPTAFDVFLIGVTAAKTLAWSLSKPLIGVDHLPVDVDHDAFERSGGQHVHALADVLALFALVLVVIAVGAWWFYFKLERQTLEADGMTGIVLRYGWFYGPGTSYDPQGAIPTAIRKATMPIVGAGGVVDAESAAELMVAGAAAVDLDDVEAALVEGARLVGGGQVSGFGHGRSCCQLRAVRPVG